MRRYPPVGFFSTVKTWTKDLSDREAQVITLIAQGVRQKDIAKQLGIQASSVASFTARAKFKLGLKTKADLVRFVMKTLTPD